MKKLLSVLLALTLVFAFASTAMAAVYTVDVEGATSAVDVYLHKGDTLKVVFGTTTNNAITADSAVTGAAIEGNAIKFTDSTVPTTATGSYIAAKGGVGGQPVTVNVKVIAAPNTTTAVTSLKKFDANNTTNSFEVVPGGVYEFVKDGKLVDLSDATNVDPTYVEVKNSVQLAIKDNAPAGEIGRFMFVAGDDTYHLTLKRVADKDNSIQKISINGQDYSLTGTSPVIALPYGFTYEDGWNDITTSSVTTTSTKAVVNEVRQGSYSAAGGSIYIKVTAEDGTAKEYNIPYRVKSNDVTLKTYTVGGYTVNMDSREVKLDSATAKDLKDGGLEKVTVVAKATNDKATVTIRVADDGSYVAADVVAEDSTFTATYYANIVVDYNVALKSVVVNNGTSDSAAALVDNTFYKATIPAPAAGASVDVTVKVVLANAADVKTVTIAGHPVTPVDGIYSYKIEGVTAASMADATMYNIVVADQDNATTTYKLILTAGAPVAPVPGTFAVSGLNNGGTYTATTTTAALTYTATNATVGTPTITMTGTGTNTAKVELTGTTTTKLSLSGLVDGKTYTLTVPVTMNGATTNYTYTIKAIFAVPLFEYLYIAEDKDGDDEIDFTVDYTAAVTDYTLESDFEVDELDDMDDLYLHYDMATGFTSSTKEGKVKVTLNGEACTQKTSDDYFVLSASDMKIGKNEVEIKYDYSGDEFEYTIEFTVKMDVDSNVEMKTVKISESKTSTSSSNLAYDFDEFDKDVTDYEISLDKEYAGKTIYLHIDLKDTKATISKATKATEVKKDDVYSVEIPKTGTVKAELTVKNGSKNATYTFTFSADGSSDKAQLKKAYIAEDDSTSASKQFAMTPAFKAGQYDYFVVIPGDDDVTDLYFNFELDNEDDDFEVVVDGGAYNDEKFTDEGEWESIEVEDGDEITITVTVTDEKDDDIENEYTFNIVKGVEDDDNDEVDMDKIVLSTDKSGKKTVALDKTFAEKTKSYTATVADSVKSIYVKPDSDDAELIIVNGKEFKTSAIEVALETGKNVIEVVAYAEDLKESLTYTITVTKGGVEDLSYLAVVSGSQTLSLSPAFNKDVHNYAAIADNSQSGVYFSAFAGEDAKITVSQSVNSTVLATKTISSTSYSTSGTFTLYTGINVFTVNISNDSDAETYYVSVYKQPTALNITKSEQKVSVDGGTAKTLYAYNINGNNFIKIRDLAVLLKGSDKQFGISYNTATTTINLTSGSSYTAQTGDNTALPAYKSGAVVSTQPFYLDGTKIVPMAYNIGGNNYLMIRDLAVFLDFAVTYNSTYNRIDIDTDASYNPTK